MGETEGERFSIRVGSVIVVLVVRAGIVVVDVPWVPRAVWEPPNTVAITSLSPPALDAPVDGRSLGVSFRHGRRDRGMCVVGGGLD